MRFCRQALRIAAVLLCLIPSLLHAKNVEVKDLRLWRAPDHTRLVLDLSGPAEHRLLELQNPRRLVVDVSDAKLLARIGALKLDNTPISKIRSGVREGDDLRLVLDLSEAVRPRSFALKASERADDRLVIDLYDLDTELAAPAVKKSAHSSGRRDIVIAIDAGHGGEDPGASGPGRLREKQVVLEIAKELHELFKADQGFAPTLIRSGDYYVSLQGRRDLARKRQADMFVSVHADAFRDKRARGASVYALSTRGATSTTASYLAQRENAADLLGGVSLGDKEDALAMTLADLSMTATLDSSLNVGASVLGEMGRFARLHKKQVEQAGFVVLKSPDVPSILVETGFISNPEEAKKLASPSYRKRMAKAIHRGIVQWFRAHPPPGSLLATLREAGEREYVIVGGDTLSGIAQRFNVNVNLLSQYNNLRNSKILVGQTLRIPAS
ncbi:N-acetylmuramoyl-L-alanine amidase [Congregibacter litoralis]|uniref:N-acetylmuramoyl-L-alanine amidase AmiC n=1 Tax=Congregibacter litoralis KT71 TaxID=314285 RepID=A4A6K8_9GAMM|nr:N-acetylmuramoyl-L-alanine amidase [Congregibacter litoralis]EAQ98655.1 N-acetylmuramoyl-L-alanine amidase [Congregibacter litoralis KT71]